MNYLKTPKIIEVLWEDHHQGMTKEPRPYLIQSVGYLVTETPKVLVLAMSIGEAGMQWSDEELTIIKKCLIKRRSK